MTISQEEFQKGILKMSFGGIKNLLVEIFTLLQNKGSKLPDTIIFDLERKQTKIWKELQRRRALNAGSNEEFMKWLYNQHDKRVF